MHVAASGHGQNATLPRRPRQEGTPHVTTMPHKLGGVQSLIPRPHEHTMAAQRERLSPFRLQVSLQSPHASGHTLPYASRALESGHSSCIWLRGGGGGIYRAARPMQWQWEAALEHSIGVLLCAIKSQCGAMQALRVACVDVGSLHARKPCPAPPDIWMLSIISSLVCLDHACDPGQPDS